MRYIGCKRRLLPFIHDTMNKYQITGDTFCDLFAGTATVGQYFKQQGYQIYACDLLYASYVQQYVKVAMNQMPSFSRLTDHLALKSSDIPQAIIDYLNRLPGVEDFIYRNYSLGGSKHQPIQRMYYSDDNAKKIDAIRNQIECWKKLDLINQDEFYVLLFALLDEASNRDNTTGKQNSFLKHYSSHAKKLIFLKLPIITNSDYQHQVNCKDSVALINELPLVDIVYLDPPYTRQQYSRAYHVLETIARWDMPIIKGVGGMPVTPRALSAFSYKRQVANALQDILNAKNYRHVLLSYNNESILSPDDVFKLLQPYGEVMMATQPLPRYSSVANPSKVQYVEEYLYYLRPNIQPQQTNINERGINLGKSQKGLAFLAKES